MKQHIWKLFIDFEKEEAWLNKMAAKGLNCVNYTFARYTFEKGRPGEYVYRLQLLENVPSHLESQMYLEFLEDTGVEHVASYFRWVFLRKKTTDGSFELFSDKGSLMAHYKRVISLLGPLTLVNLIFGLQTFHRQHNPFSPLNLAVALMGMIPLYGYYRSYTSLKKESQIRE